MLSDITIGQYFPGNSFIHRVDPRVKLGMLFFIIVAIFVLDTRADYAVFCLVVAALVQSSRLKPNMLLKALKPLWWILLFTFIIHLFSTPGTSILHVWIFDMTIEGAEKGFFLCLRLALLIVFSSILTYTTSPLALTDALEEIMSPLKHIGVPAHELAMMMTIALRFVPTLISETDKIMRAQRSRGSDFTSGNILERMKRLVPILVPLFISSFRRADELAMAMEARSYRGGVGRTRMKEMRISDTDYMALFIFAVILVIIIGLKAVGI